MLTHITFEKGESIMNLRDVGGLMRRLKVTSAGYEVVDQMCRLAGLGGVTTAQWFTLLAQAKNSTDVRIDCVTGEHGQPSRVLAVV